MATLTRRTLANAIRALSMDAVQKANSGHPGMPMGMADIAQVLWQDFLQHNPKNPAWPNRDRFVLSNGHGAMLLYSLLHLSGYDLTIEDIKSFRQLHSKTPGHPEFGDTPGVETTTGPLGQGVANAVGMALAEHLLAKKYNQPGFKIIDHWTYAFVGDGCLMEGISHEVCSLAGTLKLGKLIVIFDDNGISIDGDVRGWFGENVPQRFKAYGWEVIEGVDGHDSQAVHAAISQAKKDDQRPTIICCKTQIGFGSPNLAGSEKTHGAPLGDEEIAATRRQLDWHHPPFEVPEDIYAAWNAVEKGQALEQSWQVLFDKYQQQHPELAAELKRRLAGELDQSVEKCLQEMLEQTQAKGQDIATRKASYLVLNEIGPKCPELLGGSADLTGSNLTAWSGVEVILPEHSSGQYIHYGVREFGMNAMMNGLALHGGFVPFAGTFLTFLDYGKNAVRMSALMKQRVIYVYSHDSIGLGEDGPTHQPVEHITMLRSTPNVNTWRPADDVETVAAWQASLNHTDGPSCLLLSRQTVPHLKRNKTQLKNIQKGGYLLLEQAQHPDILLIGTGSEVNLCLQAAQRLAEAGIQANVVSMPCMEVFAQQEQSYIQSVLPDDVTARIAVEAGHGMSWHRWVGAQGRVISLETFGASAPATQLFESFGFTCDNIVKHAKAMTQEISTV